MGRMYVRRPHFEALMTTCLLEMMTGMYVYLRWDLAQSPLQIQLRNIQSSKQSLLNITRSCIHRQQTMITQPDFPSQTLPTTSSKEVISPHVDSEIPLSPPSATPISTIDDAEIEGLSVYSLKIIAYTSIFLSIVACVAYAMWYLEDAVASFLLFGALTSFTNILWKLCGRRLFREWRHRRAVLDEEMSLMDQDEAFVEGGTAIEALDAGDTDDNVW